MHMHVSFNMFLILLYFVLCLPVYVLLCLCLFFVCVLCCVDFVCECLCVLNVHLKRVCLLVKCVRCRSFQVCS